MGMEESWSLLGRLRRTVKKIKLLLNFNLNRWKIASIMSASRRRVSFNDRPGLRAWADNEEESPVRGEGSNHSSISSSRGLHGGFHRTMSCSSEEDVDKRADIFISNFYRQLQMERQVSLQLRYCRGNSFGSTTSP